MKRNIVVIFSFLCLTSACKFPDRKLDIDKVVKIYVDSSQQVLKVDELVSLYNKDRIVYEQTYQDSSIFIMGNIKSVDIEHWEVLLNTNYVDANVVCLVKDSTLLQYLNVADKVLFKGTCKAVGGDGLILITNCELAQFKK